MSDKQFKITIAVQIIIALILIYGFLTGFAAKFDIENLATKSDVENLGNRTKSDIENLSNQTKSDIENLGNRINDRLDRIESQLDKQSTRIENLNQNYINHLQAHNKQSE
jgi:short subunit dehydrogenase-like uncharacterized protein